jgi:hypothetical protein
LPVGDLATWVGAVGTVGAIVAALVVAVWQVGHQRRQGNVERTIAFHRDLTSGETGAVRDRLSEFMWRVGSQSSTNRCWQPLWEELLGARFVTLPAGAIDVSAYPADMAAGPAETPLRDLYKLLWCFERIQAAEDAGLLDPHLSTTMLGNHVVWWDTLCARVAFDRTRYRRNLHTLAEHYRTRDPALQDWAAADFTASIAVPSAPAPD